MFRKSPEHRRRSHDPKIHLCGAVIDSQGIHPWGCKMRIFDCAQIFLLVAMVVEIVEMMIVVDE